MMPKLIKWYERLGFRSAWPQEGRAIMEFVGEAGDKKGVA
jgi:hypothetical protein